MITPGSSPIHILRRKKRVLDDYSFPMCTSSVEKNRDHLFFSCTFSA
jgi:hypothetical protein